MKKNHPERTKRLHLLLEKKLEKNITKNEELEYLELLKYFSNKTK